MKSLSPGGTDILREEHRLILKGLKILDTFCSNLEDGQIIPKNHIQKMMDFITLYADAYHHEQEESVFLPYLKAQGYAPQRRYIEEMLGDHFLHKGYVDAMNEALSEPESPASRKRFVTQARNLIGLLSEHILKEDRLLLDVADDRLSPLQQKELHDLLEACPKAPAILTLCQTLEELEPIYLKTPEPSCCGCGGHH